MAGTAAQDAHLKNGWQPRFLDTLAKTGNVSQSAKAARVSRRTVYNHRAEEPEFAQAWEDAVEQAVESLEAEAWRRAARGTLKPVYQGGERVGEIREYSDTLLIFLLKGHKPEKYRERITQEHTGPGGGPVQVKDVSDLRKLPADELVRLHRETLGVPEPDRNGHL